MCVLDEGSYYWICCFLGGKDAKLGDGRKPSDAPGFAHRVRHALRRGEEGFDSYNGHFAGSLIF